MQLGQEQSENIETLKLALASLVEKIEGQTTPLANTGKTPCILDEETATASLTAKNVANIKPTSNYSMELWKAQDNKKGGISYFRE